MRLSNGCSSLGPLSDEGMSGVISVLSRYIVPLALLPRSSSKAESYELGLILLVSKVL